MPPHEWAKRDILTWRAYRNLRQKEYKPDKELGWKQEIDKRKEAEEEEREDSIDEVVEEHKNECEIKLEVIQKIRNKKKANRD